MKAILRPLDGKYYGTEILITDGRLEGHVIEVWTNSCEWDSVGVEPSERELRSHGESKEDYLRLRAEDSDSSGVDMSGGHYECVDSLLVAQAIVVALEKLELPEGPRWRAN